MPSPKTTSREKHAWNSYLKKKKIQEANLHPSPPPHHEKPISFKFPNLSILVVHFQNCACVFKQYEQLQTFKYSFFLWYAYKQLRMCNGTLQAVRKRFKFYSK